MVLARKLLEKAESRFLEYMTLSANCPECDAPLILKFASNPDRHMKKLSVIIACKNDCDRELWNTDAKEGVTHWWLDGARDRQGYERIIESLPTDERKLVRQLERQVRKMNREFWESLFGNSK